MVNYIFSIYMQEATNTVLNISFWQTRSQSLSLSSTLGYLRDFVTQPEKWYKKNYHNHHSK